MTSPNVRPMIVVRSLARSLLFSSAAATVCEESASKLVPQHFVLVLFLECFKLPGLLSFRVRITKLPNAIDLQPLLMLPAHRFLKILQSTNLSIS